MPLSEIKEAVCDATRLMAILGDKGKISQFGEAICEHPDFFVQAWVTIVSADEMDESEKARCLFCLAETLTDQRNAWLPVMRELLAEKYDGKWPASFLNWSPGVLTMALGALSLEQNPRKRFEIAMCILLGAPRCSWEFLFQQLLMGEALVEALMGVLAITLLQGGYLLVPWVPESISDPVSYKAEWGARTKWIVDDSRGTFMLAPIRWDVGAFYGLLAENVAHFALSSVFMHTQFSCMFVEIAQNEGWYKQEIKKYWERLTAILHLLDLGGDEKALLCIQKPDQSQLVVGMGTVSFGESGLKVWLEHPFSFGRETTVTSSGLFSILEDLEKYPEDSCQRGIVLLLNYEVMRSLCRKAYGEDEGENNP